MTSSASTASSVSQAAQQSSIASEIGYALAAKSLEAVRQQGEATVELIENAARLSQAIGKGKNFDAVVR